MSSFNGYGCRCICDYGCGLVFILCRVSALHRGVVGRGGVAAAGSFDPLGRGVALLMRALRSRRDSVVYAGGTRCPP
jgi:hypothetical protein